MKRDGRNVHFCLLLLSVRESRKDPKRREREREVKSPPNSGGGYTHKGRTPARRDNSFMNSSARRRRRRRFRMRSAYINDSAGPRLDEASGARARIARHKNESPFFLRAIAVKGRNHTHPNYGEPKREEREWRAT